MITGKGMLMQGIVYKCPSARTIGVVLLTITWVSQQGTSSRATIFTTYRDTALTMITCPFTN